MHIYTYVCSDDLAYSLFIIQACLYLPWMVVLPQVTYKMHMFANVYNNSRNNNSYSEFVFVNIFSNQFFSNFQKQYIGVV